MKIKTSELQGAQLDWAVVVIEYPEWEAEGYLKGSSQDLIFDDGTLYSPSTNWAQGGPIIARELINAEPHFLSAGFAHPMGVWEWVAYVLGPNNIDDPCEQHGPTPLVAAMRCYVASKLGDEVEVPEELK